MTDMSITAKHFLDLEIGDIVCYPTGEIVGVVIPFQGQLSTTRACKALENETGTCAVTRNRYTAFWITLLPSNVEELEKVYKGLRKDLTSFAGDYVSHQLFPDMRRVNSDDEDLEAQGFDVDDFEGSLNGNVLEIVFFLTEDPQLWYDEPAERTLARLKQEKSVTICVLT